MYHPCNRRARLIPLFKAIVYSMSWVRKLVNKLLLALSPARSNGLPMSIHAGIERFLGFPGRRNKSLPSVLLLPPIVFVSSLSMFLGWLIPSSLLFKSWCFASPFRLSHQIGTEKPALCRNSLFLCFLPVLASPVHLVLISIQFHNDA